jgi:hypothetical protein
VTAAQQDEVVEIGATAVDPVLDVMPVAPLGRPAAAREAASAVTVGERAMLRGADDRRPATEVEDQRPPLAHDPSNRRVTGHATDHASCNRPDTRDVASRRDEVGRRPARERVGIDHDVGGAHPAAARCSVRERQLGELHERVGAPLRG